MTVTPRGWTLFDPVLQGHFIRNTRFSMLETGIKHQFVTNKGNKAINIYIINIYIGLS